MYEAKSLNEVKEGKVFEYSAEPEFSVYKWYTCQDEDDTLIYANFQKYNPNTNIIEINVRRNCFYPDRTGINYITVSGFVMKQAATTWAPPTAYQEGMVGPHWSKGWIIEDCEICDSKCNGISLGKYLQPENENKWSTKRLKNGTQTQRDAVCQAVNDGWSKETVGSHIVRRCDVHDCEQTGIVGHMGCAFSTIEECHIHHINQKHQLLGAEIAGIKFHAPIDTTIRACHIHHCTRGIWLDWQAQGSRVTQNLLHDNTPAEGVKVEQGVALGEDLFIEVSHGPTLVDNNILLSKISCRIATQGLAFVHNIIGGPFTSIGTGTNNGPETGPRYTPYHVPHSTKISGFMTFLHGDARFYNNIFVQQEIPEYYREFATLKKLHHMNFVTGTNPYESYETAEEYFSQFFAAGDKGWTENRSKYYGKLPVYYGGNVYVNGAKGCSKEPVLADIAMPELVLEYVEIDGVSYLKTNLYEKLKALRCELTATESLGEAFEPEQRFENPDGTPIIFNRDYAGRRRGMRNVPGALEILPKDGIQMIEI